jgi:hypothetical protein
MVYREREAFSPGVNHFVRGMQYARGVDKNAVNQFSLGTPAAASATALDTDIDADGVAGTVTAQSWTADSPYGRTLTMSMDADPGAALGVYDVYGYDYLGQRMVERFTHINGSTALIYGKKAFYTVDKVVNVTAATNATTVNLGTGFRLGLPYKGDVVWAQENSILVPVYTRDVHVWLDRAAAKAVAGGTDFIYAEFPGYVKTLLGVPAGGGGATDPVITVELGGTAITGLTVTIDTSDVAGLTVSDTPTTPGYSANNRFITGGKIEIVAGAAAGAFADRIGLVLTPTQFVHPVLTDPQTLTTGDPRGTYEALMVYDDTAEIIVGLRGDNSVNSDGNGGLHGIRHVVS